jgi:hypothetical protein
MHPRGRHKVADNDAGDPTAAPLFTVDTLDGR